MATATTKLNVPLRGNIIFQTTNSDLQTALTFDTKPNTAYRVQISVLAYRTDTDSAAGTYNRLALFRTNSAGTLTQVSTTQTIGTDIEDQAGWNVIVQGNSSNQITVVVGGEGSPCQWAITSQIYSVDTVPLP